jgi:hypothetical protein
MRFVTIVAAFALMFSFAPSAQAHAARDEPAAAEPPNVQPIQWDPPASRDTGLYLERGNVGGFVGYPFTVDDELEFDSVAFGISGSYLFLPFFGVEVAGTWQSLEFLPEGVSGSMPPLSSGKIDSFVFSASALFRAVAGAKAALYGTVGMAYFVNDFKADPSSAEDLAEFGFRVGDSIENALGFNVSGGVNVLIWRSFGVFTEVRYMRATADTTAMVTDEVTQISAAYPSTQKLQSIIWSGGFRLYF